MDELEKAAYNFMNTDPLKKKKELIEQYQQRKPEKVKKAEELGLEFEESTFDYFRNEFKYYKEESDWLIKIREDLSDIEFPLGVLEYSVSCPEGIYLMAMELKKMYLEAKRNNAKFEYIGEISKKERIE